MLKGINSLLTPDVLYALCAMGHGDEVVLVDAHYPADTAARSSIFGKLLRMDGVDLPAAIRAVLSVFILDAFVENPVVRMEVDGRPDDLPEVQREVELEIERAVAQAPSLRSGSSSCLLRTCEEGVLHHHHGRMPRLGMFHPSKGRGPGLTSIKSPSATWVHWWPK